MPKEEYKSAEGKTVPEFTLPDQPQLEIALNTLGKAINEVELPEVEPGLGIRIVKDGKVFTVEALEYSEWKKHGRFTITIDEQDQKVYVGIGKCAYTDANDRQFFPFAPTLNETKLGEYVDKTTPPGFDFEELTPGTEYWILVFFDREQGTVELHDSGDPVRDLAPGEFVWRVGRVKIKAAGEDALVSEVDYPKQEWASDLSVCCVAAGSSSSSGSLGSEVSESGESESDSGDGGGGVPSEICLEYNGTQITLTYDEDNDIYDSDTSDVEVRPTPGDGGWDIWDGLTQGGHLDGASPVGTYDDGSIALAGPCPESDSSEAGSSEESSEESSEDDSSEDSKDTAIVEVPLWFSDTGYAALYVKECPEVKFEDDFQVITGARVTRVPLDKKFLQVCEPSTLRAWASGDTSWASAYVDGDYLIITLSHLPWCRPKTVNILLNGTRRGFVNRRFGKRTEDQFLANKEAINSRYPKYSPKET